MKSRQANASRRLRQPHFRAGISRAEVIVVVMVLGLLGALVFPATNRARDSARKVKTIDNMRGMGVGLRAMDEIQGGIATGSQPSSHNPRARLSPKAESHRFESISPDQF